MVKWTKFDLFYDVWVKMIMEERIKALVHGLEYYFRKYGNVLKSVP